MIEHLNRALNDVGRLGGFGHSLRMVKCACTRLERLRSLHCKDIVKPVLQPLNAMRKTAGRSGPALFRTLVGMWHVAAPKVQGCAAEGSAPDCRARVASEGQNRRQMGGNRSKQ
eukprot:1483550-Alexandrium_andersonii.AAC.1